MTVILIKRSNVSGSIPPSGSLQIGELALNTDDGGLYYHDSGSDAVDLIRARASGAASAETASYAIKAGTASLLLGSVETASYALKAEDLDGTGTGSFTGSFTGAFVGDVEGTASWAENSITASFLTGLVESASWAETASYAENAATSDSAPFTGVTRSLDFVDAGGTGKWRLKTEGQSSGTLNRTTEGLLFFDNFNRADSNTIGDGWFEAEEAAGDLSILNNALRHVNQDDVDRILRTDPSGTVDEIIIQGNFENLDANGNCAMLVMAHTSGDTLRGYDVGYDRSRQSWRINDGLTGYPSTESSETFVGGWAIVRGYVTKSATEQYVELFGSQSVGQHNLGTRLQFKVGYTGSFIESGSYYGTSQGWKDSDVDNLWAAKSKYIKVTGLPSGYYAQISYNDISLVISESADVNGEALINVKTEPLPYYTMSIYNSFDELQASFNPSWEASSSISGGFGGDIYEFTSSGDSGNEFKLFTRADDNTEKALAFKIDRRTLQTTFSGSLFSSGSVTASWFYGTASWAEKALTASLLEGSVESASFADFAYTSSISTTADSASYVTSSNIDGVVDSASYALVAEIDGFTGSFDGIDDNQTAKWRQKISPSSSATEAGLVKTAQSQSVGDDSTHTYSSSVAPVDYTASVDGQVRDGGSSGTNYGKDTRMFIKTSGTSGFERHGLLAFDLTPLSESLADGTILQIVSASVTIRNITSSSNDAFTVGLYRINGAGEAWVNYEDSFTWDTYDGSTAWDNVGTHDRADLLASKDVPANMPTASVQTWGYQTASFLNYVKSASVGQGDPDNWLNLQFYDESEVTNPPSWFTKEATSETSSVQPTLNLIVELNTSGTLTRVEEGLIFYERFNRADSNDLNYGWEEWEAAAGDVKIAGSQIEAYEALGANMGAFRPSSEVTQSDPIIIQMNAYGSQSFSITTRQRADGPANTEAYLMFASLGTKWALWRRESSSNTVLDESTTDIPTSGNWYGLRNFVSASALIFLATKPLSGSTSLNQTFIERVRYDDSGSLLTTYSKTGFQRGALAGGRMHLDEYFVYKPDVVVTGLPDGWAARLDSDTKVTETSGTAIININERPLPYFTMSILNSSDEVVAETFPSWSASGSVSGGWGGDVYSFTGPTGSTPAAASEFQLLTRNADNTERALGFSVDYDTLDAFFSGSVVTSGSFIGTASWADNVISASHAEAADSADLATDAVTALTASTADTASYLSPGAFTSPRTIETITQQFYDVSGDDYVLLGDSTAQDVNMRLPDAVVSKGREFHFIKTVAANFVHVVATGGDTIIGSVTESMTDQYQSLTVIPSGTIWWVI